METEEIVIVETAYGAAEAEQAVGMPQLDFSTYPNQIFWLLLALGAIYYIVSRIALPRIGSVLAERQGTITNDIAAAEELKQKSVAAEKAYDQSLADARAEAGKIVEANRDEMKAQMNEAIARADADIAERTAVSEGRVAEIRDGMAASVEEVARDTARAIVESMGGTVDAGAIDAAVASHASRTAGGPA